MVGKYKVITLCGSTRFKKQFMEAQKRLTLEGNIVISVGLFGHAGDQEVWDGMDEGTLSKTKEMLDDIQHNIFEKARSYRDAHVYECDNYEEFKERVKDGGFFLCHWDGTAETEAKIKEETQATIRCVPFAYEQTPGVDMVSGKPAVARVIIARSY